MELKILGKYGPFPKADGGTSSYLLKAGNKNILLDAGEGSFSRLVKEIPPENLYAIIISHSHADHTADLGVLSYYFEFLSRSGKKFDKPYLFAFDDGSDIIANAIRSPYFNAIVISDGFKFEDDITFEFTALSHPAVDHGVKIKCGGKTFAYTGDTNVCGPLENFVCDSDVFLADGGFLFKDWNENKPHLSVYHVSELSKKCGNKSIITHFNPFYNEGDIFAEAKRAGGNFIIAQEGETYEL